MNRRNHTALYGALLAASLVGVASDAHAVNVNPRGLGQVLLYPYYTIRELTAGSPYGTLLSLVNTTPSVKAVRVRFLEGRRGQPVIDFNVFLSPRDVWTAAVLPAGEGAGVATADKSCTVPVISNSAAAPSPFINAAYAGDGAGDGLDRTKEGYIEIFEMGVPTDTTVIKSITHVNGVPPCTGLAVLTTGIGMAPPQGGLYGALTLINVIAGTDYTADAVALDAFRTTGRYELPGSMKPDLRDVDPPIASLPDGSIASGDSVTSAGWAQPIDAVSAVLMQSNVYNEYVLDTGTKSGTDWVVTMPTKRFYYSGNQVQSLFQRNFTSNGACDDIPYDRYDREEAQMHSPFKNPFPETPPPGPPSTICWAATVLSFNAGGTLGSKNTRAIPSNYPNGWLDLQFPPAVGVNGQLAHTLVSLSSTTTSLANVAQSGVATYLGLPVIGFAVQSFNNGTLTDSLGRLLQSSYGGNFAHRGKATINFTPSTVQ